MSLDLSQPSLPDEVHNRGMTRRIEDYALLSDCRTAALVSRDGDVDWFCPPRYDAASVFGALLGDEEHGRWSLRPADARATSTRRYEDGTFVLVTRWEGAEGVAEVIDFLAIDAERTHLVRRVRGISGAVKFRTDVRLRFDYASALPWIRQFGGAAQPGIAAIAGPDAVLLRGVRLHADGTRHGAEFDVLAGDTRDLVLSWYRSYDDHPAAIDVAEAQRRTTAWWRRWSSDLHAPGEDSALVTRSLLVLRALSHRDTGGIVAAPTTSLPEVIGGERNWDYRYVWLRDAALTLTSLVHHGHLTIARHWRSWLLRAIAGNPDDVQIVYGVGGERHLDERIITSLPGFAGSGPVRVGNGAVTQFQGDVLGEVLVALDEARRAGLPEESLSWALQRTLVDHLIATKDVDDRGIWEMRGPARRFVHSRVMMWAGLDRAIAAVIEGGLDGDAEAWTAARDELRTEIDASGVVDGHFVQYVGTSEVDASLLMLPRVGFCAWDDPRMLATVARIESDLVRDGFVFRYRTDDGVPGADNAFVACSFWLVEQYARTGRGTEARALMDRTVGVANDVGLLAEEYDVVRRAQAGNVPQAFSHLALVRAADALRETY